MYVLPNIPILDMVGCRIHTGLVCTTYYVVNIWFDSKLIILQVFPIRQMWITIGIIVFCFLAFDLWSVRKVAYLNVMYLPIVFSGIPIGSSNTSWLIMLTWYKRGPIWCMHVNCCFNFLLTMSIHLVYCCEPSLGCGLHTLQASTRSRLHELFPHNYIVEYDSPRKCAPVHFQQII